MQDSSNRLPVSLVVYVLWIAITAYGGSLLLGGEHGSLDQLVRTGIGWQFLAAIALLLASIAIFRWKDLRFTRPHSVLRATWFPALYLVAFAGAVLLVGLPPGTVVFFVALNTLLVGISEETMFRGVLFRAFEDRMAIWPAILLTSALFGAVHLINIVITGEVLAAVLQSVAAAMSGILFMAILLRTGSIWPAIVYHWFWDCLVFLLTISAGSADAPSVAGPDTSGGLALLTPVLLNLPNLVFALILLRNIHSSRTSPPTSGEHGHT